MVPQTESEELINSGIQAERRRQSVVVQTEKEEAVVPRREKGEAIVPPYIIHTLIYGEQ